ncbi:acyltransferase [Methanoculleus sp. Afa-1]|uniref:Acyltransferase n=2 Tax=Methanoculleus formosensis TaxID=2590886 RepID=A0A9E4ZLH1_9EURY|nr:acyltransferase [Methanoculleus sp. Afa-1]
MFRPVQFNLMENKVRYFDEINILRAFAILAVISIHVSANFTHMDTINGLAALYMSIDVLSHFAVPLFIVISGFVLYNKYSDDIDIKRFYRKRLKSVLPQYLIFSTFYLAAPYIGSIVLARPVNLDILHIIYRYLTGGCFYHLWFFVLIIQLYLLYPAILRLYNYCEVRGRILELLFAVYLIGVLYNVYPIPDIFILGASTQILGVATKFIGYVFYLVLGMTIRRRYDELLLKSVPKSSLYYASIPLLCCTIIGIFGYAQSYFNFDITQILPVMGGYWHWLTAVIDPLYYVVIFAFSFYISLNIVSSRSAALKLLEKIGAYSFGIYLIHAFILYIIVLTFPRFGFDWNNWLFYPLICIITLVLSYLSVEVLQKFPYSEYLIGSTK